MREWTTSSLARAARRVRQWLNRGAVDDAMTEEMRHHIACEAAERIAAGESADAAWRAAKRDFGGLDRHREDARDVLGLRILDDAGRDAAYACRVLRRNRSFTISVIATVGLTVACAAVIYGVINSVLIRPLPYDEPDRLMTLWERDVSRSGKPNVASLAAFEAWRDQSRSFSALAALSPAPVTIGGAHAERVTGVEVSSSYFQMLGIHPALGRAFNPGDERLDAPMVTLLSDGFWRSRFGADAAIVGKTIAVDDHPVTIIGVMPAGFEPPRFGWIDEQPLWFPFITTPQKRSWGRFLHVVGRLGGGVSRDAGDADIQRISDALGRTDRSHAKWSATVVPLSTEIVGPVREPLIVVGIAVLLLFAIAIANVGSLARTFALARQREMTVRLAIGATRARLARQRLVQAIILSMAGASTGALGALLGVRALVPALATVPRTAQMGVAPIIAFAIGAAIIVTGVLGVAGRDSAARPGVRVDGPTSFATSSIASRLIVFEVATGVVLATAAVLVGRSFEQLRRVDLGFDPDHVVTARVVLTPARYPTDAAALAFFTRLTDALRHTPGVRGASVVMSRPFACCAPATTVRDAGVPTDDHAPIADVRYADSAYFATMRISLVEGTTLSAHPSLKGVAETVVSRQLATTLWGNTDAVGRTMAIQLYGTTYAKVIGVVGDVHLTSARTPTRPAVYLSAVRYSDIQRDVVVRGDAPADVLLATLQSAVAGIDPTVPLSGTGSLSDVVGRSLAQDRLVAAVLAGFAIVAALLAAVGVFGVLAEEVRRRRREIGVRMALGANQAAVMRLMLGIAMRPTLAGTVFGVAGAFVGTRWLDALLFGIGARDPASFASVALLLLVVALAATVVPALRAARVPPAEVIRLQ